MAFTPEQENALLALLDEPLVTLNELPKAIEIDDEDLFLTRQETTERAVTGDVMKDYFASPATLGKRGTVQLTNDVDSESEDKAVTPLGVKTSLADYLPLSGGTLNGSLKVPQLCLQSESQIHIPIFDRNNQLVSGIYQETDRNLCLFVNKHSSFDTAGKLIITSDGRIDIVLGDTNILPVGVPVPWPNQAPPPGWVKCNGAAFDKENYPVLAKAYPSGFLPDLRSEFIRGWDDGRGIDTDREILSWQEDDFKSHNHAYYDNNSSGGQAGPSRNQGEGLRYTEYTGGNETRPRNVAFLYIVRAA